MSDLARLGLIVSDVDGTLVELGGMAPSPRLKAAVDLARGSGVRFGLATARTWEQTRPVAEALGLEGEVAICCQGAQVVGIKGPGEVPSDLRLLTLEEDLARQMVEWVRIHGLRPSLVIGHRYTWQRGEALPATMNFGVEGWAEVHDLLAGSTDQVIKFMAYGEPAHIETIVAPFREAFGGRASIMRGTSSLIEGTAPDADKGTGLLWLMSQLGLEPDRVAVLGDGENDLSLFDAAGYRIAIGDSHPALSALADRSFEGPGPDGPARAIEWLLARDR